MPKNAVKIVTGLGAASVLAVSGAALASSQTTSPSAPSSTPSSTQQAPDGHGHRHGTPVTGGTLTAVTNAVKAKDAAVTVKVVFKHTDGSYDAMGMKAGKPVHVDVSKDLKTIAVKTGFGHGDRDGRGPGGHMHGTPVTGTTLTNVTAAVKAKDSAVTVERVFKGADGTYHAMGMKAGKPVHVKVSADLKTVTVKTGGPDGRGHRGGPGGHEGFGGPGGRGGFPGAQSGMPGQQGSAGQPNQAPSGAATSGNTSTTTAA